MVGSEGGGGGGGIGWGGSCPGVVGSRVGRGLGVVGVQGYWGSRR